MQPVVRLLLLTLTLSLAFVSVASAASVGGEFSRAAQEGKIDDQEAKQAKDHFNKLSQSKWRDFVVQRKRISSLAARKQLAPRAKGFALALRAYAVKGDKPIGTRYQVGDSLVAQRMAGSGWQFHPLASAGRLNGLAANKKISNQRLYQAGRDLALSSADFSRYEYQFRWLGGGPGWISGMTQAIAASAFARIYKRTGSKLFRRAALNALKPMYRSRPRGTSRFTASGINSLLYPFRPNLLVANAQLWATLSVDEAAETLDSLRAKRLADGLVRRSLSELDNYAYGPNWTLYAIGSDPLAGKPADNNYHTLTVQALRRLCQRRGDRFCDYAERYGKDVPLSVQSGAQSSQDPLGLS